jgi:hypothetical protein
MPRVIRLCSFDSADHLTGRERTYTTVKAAVLEAGRFSVFEATQDARSAKLFTRLCHDPELETFQNPPEFPWTGVRLRAALCDAAEEKP